MNQQGATSIVDVRARALTSGASNIIRVYSPCPGSENWPFGGIVVTRHRRELYPVDHHTADIENLAIAPDHPLVCPRH